MRVSACRAGTVSTPLTFLPLQLQEPFQYRGFIFWDAKQLYRVEDGPFLVASFSSLLLSVTPCAFQRF